MDNTLEVIDLTKKYGKTVALDNISYKFTSGIYGILGPNGAGKSTFLNIVTAALDADKGIVNFNGKSIKKLKDDYRKKIAYVPQQQKLFEEFTGMQFMGYFAALKGIKGKDAMPLINQALENVNLTDAAYKKISAYSGGMKQRLLIAQSMLSDFDILILDEPTTGLDPEERIRVRKYIQKLSESKIILLATHIVSDVETVADTILMFGKGKIIKSGSVDELISHYNAENLEEVYMKVQ